MAGYSGTPLPKKLGIKEGHRLAYRPPARSERAGRAARGVEIRTSARPPRRDRLLRDLAARARAPVRALKRALEYDGGLWIAWPKRASGVETDVTEDVVREIALAAGLVDNKVCAIDETWSGLRLVYRLADRP